MVPLHAVPSYRTRLKSVSPGLAACCQADFCNGFIVGVLLSSVHRTRLKIVLNSPSRRRMGLRRLHWHRDTGVLDIHACASLGSRMESNDSIIRMDALSRCRTEPSPMDLRPSNPKVEVVEPLSTLVLMCHPELPPESCL